MHSKKPAPPSAPKKQKSFPPDQSLDIQHRFKNLENPLKFIENESIMALESNYKRLKTELKREQEDKADFSKSIYKKVISRDNEYTFQHDLVGYEPEDTVIFNHKHSRAGQVEKTEERVKKEDLERRFKHGQNITLEEKRQRLREEKEIPLTFRHVKLIDTPDFDQLKDVEFYHLIKGQPDEKDFAHSSNQISNAAVLSHLESFKHKLLEESQYHSKTSYNFLLNCNRELRFWKVGNIFKDEKKSDEQVLANCAFMDTYNISLYDMFDFSSRNIEINDIIKFYALKKTLGAKMEMQRNNQSLEEKYNDAKRRFEEMKENRLKSKNQRLPAKFLSTLAQTNDDMKEKDFDDYFTQDANDIFDRLKQLNQVRDRVIENQEGETFNIMATNIGLEISNQLFKLLLVVLRGEDVSNPTQFIRADNEDDVEQFKNFKQYEVNGFSKVEIIKKYLEEREKNQRFYETYLIKKNDSNPTRTALIKNTMKNTSKSNSNLTPTKNSALTKTKLSSQMKPTKQSRAK